MQKQPVEREQVDVGRRTAVRDMVSTPGWLVFYADAEDALMEAMMAIMSIDPSEVSAPAKIAYWRGRVDAIRAVFLWEIDMTSESQEEKAYKAEGLFETIKSLIRKLIGA